MTLEHFEKLAFTTQTHIVYLVFSGRLPVFLTYAGCAMPRVDAMRPVLRCASMP
jgi:hypothetical protein